ncbi:MAG: recombinase RecT, partial [Betaproteobacteria bacterium]
EKSVAPNAMWQKRPYAQLAKCAEAQALRKAFPEFGSAATADEMEGKEIDMGSAEIVSEPAKPVTLPDYTAEDFRKNLEAWRTAVQNGRITTDQVIVRASSKYKLSDEQVKEINGLNLDASVDEDGAIDAEFVSQFDKESSNA